MSDSNSFCAHGFRFPILQSCPITCQASLVEVSFLLCPKCDAGTGSLWGLAAHIFVVGEDATHIVLMLVGLV